MAVLLTPTLAVSITSPTGARLTIGNVGVGSVNIEIERKAAGGSFALVETIGGSGTVIWDDNGLVDGTAWTWRVRLTDGLGSYGSYSSEESGTTPLPAADGLYSVGSPTSVDLHWTRRAQNNTGVKIWRTSAGGATFGLLYTGTTPSEVSYTDNTVAAGQTYKYYVETYNSLTSADSSEVSVFTADPPNAPTLNALIALGTTSLRGLIQDNSDNEEGFTWEWGTDGVTFGSSGTTGPNITTFDMTGLTSNQRYYVRVMATNASGSSAYSNVLSLSTLAAVAPPRLAVTPWGSGRIECVLADCSELETDHRIERRILDYVSEKITDGGLENWASAAGSQTYTSGSGNWTVPAGVTSVDVECWGGGGGGGGDDSTRGGGGGGGGGAYSKKTAIAVTPGGSIPYAVGTGGSAAAGANGGAGGDTTFNSTTVVAKGGAGGKCGAENGTAGAGGSAASGTGDTKYNGGNGGAGAGYSDGYEGGGGGSGSSAGTGANGGNGGAASGATGGSAGSAPTGGGAGAAGASYSAGGANGSAGTAPGGGGSGSSSRDDDGGGYLSGGAGAAGKIIISWSGTPTDLTSWTETKGGTSAITRESSEIHGGFCALKAVVDGSDNNAYINQAETLIASAPYRLTVWYKTEAAKTLALWLKDSAANVYLKSDGTWGAGAQYIILPASTSWTSFTIDLTAHASYTAYVLYVGHLSGTSTQTSATFYLDDITLLGEPDFTEIATLEPNREFYPDTGLTAGKTYEYRARARQSGSPDVYSAYSDVVSATVLSAPDAPTSPAVSEYQDTYARLTWTKSASGDEAGYEIYKALSGGAFSLYRTVGAGVEYCKVSGLAASTAYEFKVRAINAAGNSAYTSTVSLTTRSSYVRSKFEKLQLQTKPADWLDLIEINPTITLAGWALASGKTYTYQIALSEPVGIQIEGVTENGEDLDLKASIAEVEAAAGSFYFDYASQTVYVHPSGSDDPADYYYLGSFWMRFTTGDTRQAASRQPVVLSGKHYIPLVPSDGIPDITQTIQPQYQGDYKPAHGSVSLINGISKAWGNVGFFDKLSVRYNWKGRRVLALGGRIGWSYQDFYPFSGGVVTSTNWSDTRFTLTLRDIRELMGRDLPRYDYWESDFPNLDTNSRGKPRPLFYGDIVGYAPVCIDTVNRVFELNNGRIAGGETINVYQNDIALTSGTDYYVDYQRGRITLSRSLTYESTDKITADFTGRPDDLDAPIELGPMILLNLLLEEIGLASADIDLDSFYEAAETATTALVLPISKVRSLDSCIELVEKSCMGWLVQDNQGRLAFRLQQTSAPSGILYIPNARIKDGFASDDPEDNTYAGIDVGYAESFEGTYRTVRIDNNVARWRDGAQDILPINTLVPAEAAASALGTSMAAALGKRIVSFEVDRCLYTATPGDLVYLSRTRYPSATGVAANVLCRVMSLTKSRSTGSTSGTLQEVA